MSAESLYPSMASEEQTTDPSTPYAVQQARNEDSARRMFSATKAYSDSEVDWLLPDAATLSEADRPAVLNELKEVAADYELSASELGQIRNWASIQKRDKPDAAKQQAEGRKRLAERYGKHRADQVLEDVRKLVGRDPRFSRLLDNHRLGDDPDLLMMMAEKAQSMRNRGKFR